MAHFAELDENNVVLRVVVIANADTHDINGIESEEIGIATCKKLFGVNTRWRQTSYNDGMRKRFAGVGSTYDEVLDAFVPPKVFSSWVLNTEEASWEAPVPMPQLTEEERAQGYRYTWNEDIVNWEKILQPHLAQAQN